jgi:hypothetical protein
MSSLGIPRPPEVRAAISRGLRRFHAARPSPGLGLRELVARSSPDECPFCGEPRAQRKVPNARHPITCGDEICKHAYHRLYGRDRRAKAVAP